MFTRADLSAIHSAIAKGVLEVEHSDGKKIKYRSMTDLIRAADYIETQLSGSRWFRKRTFRAGYDRDTGGYDSDRYDRYGY